MAWISDQLRDALNNCEKTRYQVAAETGISASVLSRFVNGKMIHSDTADYLADYLGLELRPKPKSSRKGR